MQSLFSIICFQVLCVLRPFTAFIIFSRSGLRDYGLFCLGICLFLFPFILASGNASFGWITFPFFWKQIYSIVNAGSPFQTALPPEIPGLLIFDYLLLFF